MCFTQALHGNLPARDFVRCAEEPLFVVSQPQSMAIFLYLCDVYLCDVYLCDGQYCFAFVYFVLH